MSATRRVVLLLALCAGVLLIGIELFVTAVALPSIVKDLADWTQLRRASWIVNGYLVAYIAAMPLAGRAADRYGLPRLTMAALGLFAVGCLLCGAAQTLDQLIAARVVQGAGAGAVLPLATAGATILFTGTARPRALGFVGAATFLGMALGPFLGALVLGSLDLTDALRGIGAAHGLVRDLVTPAWRWIFYLAAPLALVVMLYVWAASPEWPTSSSRGRIDARGAFLFSGALAAGLFALSIVGEEGPLGGLLLPVAAGGAAVVLAALAWRHLRRTPDPFIDLALFRQRAFSAAILVSVLTGYGLATAVVGSAVFVDRVRYAGPEDQRVVLGALALAVAVGSFVSGFALGRTGSVLLTMVGLTCSVVGLVVLSTAVPTTELGLLAAMLALYGLGFGLTVTPRSTTAVESAGEGSYGVASAAVTVSRMLGMAVGLAILTGFGTTRIDALTQVVLDPAARDAVLPAALQGRPLTDVLVVDALESWAAGVAASTLGILFLVAALVTALAAVPALAMGDLPRLARRAAIRAERSPSREEGQ